nr:transposase [uncultured Desulfobacter sp.]
MDESYPLKIHHRRSIRLRGYDYSQAGLYFITICSQGWAHLFGKIIDGEMVLNDAGRMVDRIWHEIPDYYDKFITQEFVVMPNHIHGILKRTVGAGPCACPRSPASPRPDKRHGPGQSQQGQPQWVAPTGPPSSMALSDVVGRFKSLTMKQYIDGVNHHGWQPFNIRLWQRNYWEHIIRNDYEYQNIAQYILDNPKRWEWDKLNGGIGNQVMESRTAYDTEVWMV